MVLMMMGSLAAAEPVPVEVRQTEAGWQLFRGGEPYVLKGAGGTGPMDQLAAAGANSVRTWGVDNLGETLDAAQEHGLTVAAGIWLGHERHGFDYNDPAQVSKQFEAAKLAVLTYKDHPALLVWGVGNEMEGYQEGDNPKIWKAVEDIAAMIKTFDPNHPTMTVTAEIGGNRIQSINDLCPSIDIHGINSYGGAPSIAGRYREGGGAKPYILTEFGPVGSWEVPTTSWGAPPEATSTEKAAFYRRSYESAVLGAPDVALGAYAFVWGFKMEATATWFGMFLPDGSRTASIDTMTELWSGKPPENLSPRIEPLTLEGGAERDPNEVINVKANVVDPEGADLRVTWALRRESGEYATGGDVRPLIPDIEGAIVSSDASGAQVKLPAAPGPYRLFFYAYDGQGQGAVANLPLLVKGEVGTPLPFPVYEDSFAGMPWAPSGYMGEHQNIALTGDHKDGCYKNTCIRIDFDRADGWGGIAWQNPPNNWGEEDGGFDVSGATELVVWAKGEKGGEGVSFAVGILGDDTKYPDSARVEKAKVYLKKKWKQYRIKLKRKDLSSLKTGFVVSWGGDGRPVSFYLDEIQFR